MKVAALLVLLVGAVALVRADGEDLDLHLDVDLESNAMMVAEAGLAKCAAYDTCLSELAKRSGNADFHKYEATAYQLCSALLKNCNQADDESVSQSVARLLSSGKDATSTKRKGRHHHQKNEKKTKKHHHHNKNNGTQVTKTFKRRVTTTNSTDKQGDQTTQRKTTIQSKDGKLKITKSNKTVKKADGSVVTKKTKSTTTTDKQGDTIRKAKSTKTTTTKDGKTEKVTKSATTVVSPDGTVTEYITRRVTVNGKTTTKRFKKVTPKGGKPVITEITGKQALQQFKKG